MVQNEEKIQLKDGKSASNGRMSVPPGTELKDIKNSYPVQMAEYAVENRILEEPAFAWWTKHVLNKRYQILSKMQQYWVQPHKYGLRVPKTVNEAVDIDQDNGNTL